MGTYDDFEFFDIQVCDGVAVATICGAGETNDLTLRGHEELGLIWGRLAADTDVRAVVITGEGDVFSTGVADEVIAPLHPLDLRHWVKVMEEARQIVTSAISFEKPVVTALNGPTSGSTLTMALLTDIVITEPQVTFSDHHVPSAHAAGDGGVLVWPHAMGLLRAKRYLLTGDALTAREAERLGLVTEVVDKGASLDRALVYARRFADGDARAIQVTKRALNQYLRDALHAYDLSWTGEILTGLLKGD
jgi:enoyl-CoA hydratase